MKFKILPITGDASFRTFYRLVLNKNSKIIVLASKEKYKNLIAYAAINKFLRNNKILAPKLYTQDFSRGILVIEDFGDKTYNRLIQKKKNKLAIYKKLIDLLISIQKIKPKSKIKHITTGFHKIDKYSIKHLFKESNLFFDWYLPLFLNKKKVFKIKMKSKKILTKLYKKISFSNSYFVHRDYHPQNLMKVGKKIGLIDSQDALIGNPAYDLVSLIDDVRIKNSNKLKNKIYNYYLKQASKKYIINKTKFLEDFNILSVQRCLKIIGIFSRLYKRDRKSRYLKFMPYTWKLLDMRMKPKIFTELRMALKNDIPKTLRNKKINK